jgi:hypothetical protein
MEDHSGAGELWEHLSCLFPNKREQRLMYLSYNCGLKPGEIIRLCPGEFSDVQEIYRLRRSILERMRCDTVRGRLESSEETGRNMEV